MGYACRISSFRAIRRTDFSDILPSKPEVALLQRREAMEPLHPAFALSALCAAILYAGTLGDAVPQSRVSIAPKGGACAPEVVAAAIDVASLDRFAAQTSDDTK